MAGRKTSAKLHRKSKTHDVSLSADASWVALESPDETVVPQRRASFLSARESIVRVMRELDQILSMDTLIYFIEAAIELLFLSIYFFYQQPVPRSVEKELQRISPHRPANQTHRQSTRTPIWKKIKQPPVRYPSRQLDRQLCDFCGVSGADVFVAQKVSGTGSSLSTTQLTAHRPRTPSSINSRLPPPPSLLTLSSSFSQNVSHPSTKLLPSIQATPIIITDNAIKSGSTPEPKSRTDSPTKSPRRKPVPRSVVRKTSAKLIRPPLPPSVVDPNISQDTASDPIESTSGRSPPLQTQASAPPRASSSAQTKTPPPIVRKSSAKFVRTPQKPTQIVEKPDNSVQTSPLQNSDRIPPLTKDIPVQLARKSSAKFVRPPLPPQSIPAQPLPPSQPSINPPIIASDQTTGSIILEHGSETERDLTSVSAIDTGAHNSHTIQSEPENKSRELVEPLVLLEPIPQIPISQPHVFPPQPAIVVIQSDLQTAVPDQPLHREPSPPLTSFPELPPLAPVRPRQPPPPPSIPRFPSPTKSLPVSTTPPPAEDTEIESTSIDNHTNLSNITSSRRFVSMAAIATTSEEFVGPTDKWIRPETSYQLSRSSFPLEWDPSRDDNIFSTKPTTNPRTVVSTTPDQQRLSHHGSVASKSSTDSPPQNGSREQSTSPHQDGPNKVRPLSNYTRPQSIPSPFPSPMPRPRSTGSLSSGSDLPPPSFLFDNTHLKPGNAAALLSHAETLNLYRQNAKKAVDNPASQYEFAIFMMDSARESTLDLNGATPTQRDELMKEGLAILRRLADRGYPQAQYYLADCYSNGIGCKNGEPDLEKAFPLFVLAAKHGHIEASFRTALAYEHAWGCRRDPLKAIQFLRKAASGNHPGAMLRLGRACLNSEFGIPNTQPVRFEGVNWLKRAVEAATPLYPNAPYELALLHEIGYKDVVFPDEAYAVQLFQKASDLGHAEASYRLGDAYEYGRMGCPEDPGLSIHYYSLAARSGNANAMLSLCAWYMVGAEGLLEKSDEEAFAWAHQAAESGLAKAEFAVGYFLERGVGCRRDPLEAWKYYVRAAEHGDERAKSRLKAGKELNSDRSLVESSATESEGGRLSMSDQEARKHSPRKTRGETEDEMKGKESCVIM